MLHCRAWKRAREKLRHYRRRTPETSALYQIVYHLGGSLSRVWEERFQGTYGAFRDEVSRTFDAYLNCGLPEHGGARIYCDTCKHSLLVAFSCKKRGVCPSCAAKRAVKFGEHIYDTVLERVPHRHIVFTIPKRLRVYLRYDRGLNSLLFRAARQTVSSILSPSTGMILTVQTAGESLNFHPHLHGLLADGAFQGSSFIPFGNIDSGALTRRFQDEFLAALRIQELISDDDVHQILSQEHSGFSVWLGEPFLEEERTRFLARYIERAPLSLEKLSLVDDIVSYTPKDGITSEFDPLEFLALLSTHIPKPYESITRYYGWYSSRRRGERKKIETAEPGPVIKDTVREDKHSPSPAWAASIKRIYEIDPLECPRCKAPMRIIAFIHDPIELKKIMRSLDIPYFKPPPPVLMNSPPAFDSPIDDIPDTHS